MKKNGCGYSRLKRWATPLCMLLCLTAIAAMAVDSFAKYYHSFSLPKQPIVAIFANGLTSGETIYTLDDHSPTAITGKNSANRVTETVLISPQAFKKRGNNHAANTSYTVQVSNTENGKTCEVALKYTLTIAIEGKVPLGVTAVSVTSENGTELGKFTRPPSPGSQYWTVSGTPAISDQILPAGESTTHKYHVAFTYEKKDDNRNSADTDCTITVTVAYEQILPE